MEYSRILLWQEDMQSIVRKQKKIMKPGRNPWSFFMQKNNENLGKTLTYGAPYVIIYT
ncbi:hypothetical protein I2800192A2_29160 [Anaerostipes hadrus]